MVTDSKIGSPRRPHRKRLGAAYVWLLLFMVVYCARPEDWIPGLSHIPLAKIAGGLTILALLFALDTKRQRLPREVLYLILLFIQLWICVAMSPVWRGGAFHTMLEFTKVLPIVLVIALVVDTIRKLRWLIFVQSVSVATIAAVTIWKGQHVVGRLRGLLNGNYSDPNDLAFAIAISAPLCLYFLFRGRGKLSKPIWAVAILVMIYAVFLTASRGGLISLTVGAAVCLWEFGIRRRRRYLLVVTLVAGVAFWVVAGKGLRLRFNANAGTVDARQLAAYGSAEQRWGLLIQGIKVTAEHPLFGIGPGNFPVLSGNWHVTHNSYTQMSSEGGVLALVLYLLVIGRGFRNLAAAKRLTAKRLTPSDEEKDTLACALSATLVAFVFGSFFLSEAYQFFPYFFVAYTTALYLIAARDREEADVDQARTLEIHEDQDEWTAEDQDEWTAAEEAWPAY